MSAPTLRLSALVMCAAVCAAQLLVRAQSAEADDRLRQIIDNVRANEALYENIEVRMAENFELVGQKPLVFKLSSNEEVIGC